MQASKRADWGFPGRFVMAAGPCGGGDGEGRAGGRQTGEERNNSPVVVEIGVVCGEPSKSQANQCAPAERERYYAPVDEVAGERLSGCDSAVGCPMGRPGVAVGEFVVVGGRASIMLDNAQRRNGYWLDDTAGGGATCKEEKRPFGHLLAWCRSGVAQLGTGVVDQTCGIADEMYGAPSLIPPTDATLKVCLTDRQAG